MGKRQDEESSIIKEMKKMTKNMKYKPKVLWINFEGDVLYLVTDDIDRNAKLLKKYK
jgi:hypothetical protein